MRDHKIQQHLPLELPESPQLAWREPAERPTKSWHVWDSADDSKLTSLFRDGETTAEMARILDRPPKGVAARLVRLGLIRTRRQAP